LPKSCAHQRDFPRPDLYFLLTFGGNSCWILYFVPPTVSCPPITTAAQVEERPNSDVNKVATAMFGVSVLLDNAEMKDEILYCCWFGICFHVPGVNVFP
jgi:hypothetical protein